MQRTSDCRWQKRFHTLKKFALGVLAIGILLVGMGVAPKKTSSSTIKYDPNKIEQVFLEPNPQDVQRLYEEWQKSKVEIKKKVNFDPCSCVSFVKAITGYNKPVGRARNFPINSNWASIGSVVVTNESPSGHVAIVAGIEGNTLLLDETNWLPCQRGKRKLSIDDPSIIGFWTP